MSTPKVKVLCGSKQLVIRVNEAYRKKIHRMAKSAELSTRQFVLQAIEKAIILQERAEMMSAYRKKYGLPEEHSTRGLR